MCVIIQTYKYKFVERNNDTTLTQFDIIRRGIMSRFLEDFAEFIKYNDGRVFLLQKSGVMKVLKK